MMHQLRDAILVVFIGITLSVVDCFRGVSVRQVASSLVYQRAPFARLSNSAAQGEDGDVPRAPFVSLEDDDDDDDDGDGDAPSEQLAGFVLRNDTRRYVGRVLYDGSTFRGWQDQDARLRTVQGTMNKIFRQRFDLPNVHVTGSSRTDHGVHANGQCFHFDLPSEVTIPDYDKFSYTMNRMLPDDIKIWNVTNAPLVPGGPYFHAIASATSKHYSYRFSTNEFVPPRMRRYCTHVWQPIDLDLMQTCLACFVGSHDFSAFANRIEHTTRDFSATRMSKFSCRRHIESINMHQESPGMYCVDINLNSALYRMVRNIVGTSLLVSTGRMPLAELKDLLARHPSRKENKAKSAPPEGLTLEKVFFAHY